jgi:hypothetical protein
MFWVLGAITPRVDITCLLHFQRSYTSSSTCGTVEPDCNRQRVLSQSSDDAGLSPNCKLDITFPYCSFSREHSKGIQRFAERYSSGVSF